MQFGRSGKMLVGKLEYRDYIIEANCYNIYRNKPFTYVFEHVDETDGRCDYGTTIDECINKINEIYENL